jgi:hypothetical protein
MSATPAVSTPVLQPVQNADLAAKVRAVMPFARSVITRGVSDLALAEVGDDDSLPAYVSRLLGHNGPVYEGYEQHRRFEAWTEAAYVLGLAIGLHLRASTFEEGGAR